MSAPMPHAAPDTTPGPERPALPDLVFVIDVPDWAYANIVNHIAPHLEGRYRIHRRYIVDYPDTAALMQEVFIANRFDHVHFMWREPWLALMTQPWPLRELARLTGLSADDLAQALAAPVVTTTIYDHLFLTVDEIEARRTALAMTDGYSVASALLGGIYAAEYGRTPDAETADGVNTAFFRRAPAPRPSGPFRIGWVGNSGWGAGKPGVGDDPKGLHSILTPAIAALKAEGRDVELVLADRNLRQRDRDQMRAYYADEIDVLVCASAFEGTPNPVLEAAASARAWVSTDVGIVREVAGPLQAAMILPERSPEAMADVLRALMDDPAGHDAIEAENAARAPGLDWVGRVPSWDRLLTRAAARHGEGTGLLRREIIATRLLAMSLPGDSFASASGEGAGKDLVPAGGFAALIEADRRITGLETWLNEARTQLAQKDGWIVTLQERIQALEAWTVDLRARIAELETALHDSTRHAMRRVLLAPLRLPWRAVKAVARRLGLRKG